MHQFALDEFYAGKTVVVTGGSGSVGSALVRRLLELDVAEVRCLDNNESALFDFEQEMAHESRFVPMIASITNEWEVRRAFTNADHVFHAAALKHVPACERNPFSAVETNILGVKTVIRSAQECGVKSVLFTSSDKAVSPTNVMGASKLMGERLFSAADRMALGGNGGGRTLFASTRFGNVAGSRGSVIPLFCRQIAQGRPLTLTDERMTRYMMTLREATELVLGSLTLARGGEIFITKMPSMRIADLADVMRTLLAPAFGYAPDDIGIRAIGMRPGEKLWEELCTGEESRYAVENDDYICVLAADAAASDDIRAEYATMGFRDAAQTHRSDQEQQMTKEEIRDFLMQEGVLPTEIRDRVMRRA